MTITSIDYMILDLLKTSIAMNIIIFLALLVLIYIFIRDKYG